jgi:hypothetical protein
MLSWEQRIERAGETVTTGHWFWKKLAIRGFSREDLVLAEDWACCPNGQADSRIPRNWDRQGKTSDTDVCGIGAPLDEQLISLGIKFYRAVKGDHVERALILYHKIQERVELLVEDIEKATPKKRTRKAAVKEK